MTSRKARERFACTREASPHRRSVPTCMRPGHRAVCPRSAFGSTSPPSRPRHALSGGWGAGTRRQRGCMHVCWMWGWLGKKKERLEGKG